MLYRILVPLQRLFLIPQQVSVRLLLLPAFLLGFPCWVLAAEGVLPGRCYFFWPIGLVAARGEVQSRLFRLVLSQKPSDRLGLVEIAPSDSWEPRHRRKKLPVRVR